MDSGMRKFGATDIEMLIGSHDWLARFRVNVWRPTATFCLSTITVAVKGDDVLNVRDSRENQIKELDPDIFG